MSLSDKLSHVEYLQVTDTHSNKSFCGSDQEWFSDERQRLTGCAPSAAANILFYLSRKKNPACCGKDRSDLLYFMEDAWKSVTPETNGIPSTSLFLEKLRRYAYLHEKEFNYSVLDIPVEKAERPSLSTVATFISQGLQQDIPIAFLNLDNGAEKNLESWHWVTIAELDYSENTQTAKVLICDEGITKQINLKLWVESTIQGGGFVYFRDMNNKIKEFI